MINNLTSRYVSRSWQAGGRRSPTWSRFPFPDGDFTELQGQVRACCPPDILALDLLLGVTIEAELFVGWTLLDTCAAEFDTYGTLTDVRLEITGSVPTDATTWSEVKALYR
jgi:hypothetical protein